MVDKQLISEIKNSVNIVDVIGEVVQLTKAGRNFLGLCPFHGEKTPSFNVVEDKQFYHCFGCGRSGDVFKFIEDYRGVSFMEAVQTVGDQVGIRVQTLPPSQSRPQQADGKQPFYEIHQEAAKFYHAILMTTKMGEEARQYLYDRGLDDEVLRHFQIGLAPAESLPFLVDSGVNQLREQSLRGNTRTAAVRSFLTRVMSSTIWTRPSRSLRGTMSFI